ncbi:MAG: HlyD family secretion protein [Gemmatimonadota bacterium]|nr:HlyD family secretion protein [Gemmatimonadota bacterium]
MRQVGRRTFYLLPALLVVGGSLAWYTFTPADGLEDTAVTATVKRGDLAVVVTTTGELRARKFVQVSGPATAQMANVYQTKISSMVPEGQLVKEGDVIAELDRGPVAARLSDVTIALQKASAQYTSAQLDSALNLAQAREDVKTAEYLLEEKRLAKEQAQFEAPTIKRQAEIDYEKAERGVERAKSNLQTKLKQAIAKMDEVGAERNQHANRLRIIQEVMTAFTVRAPSPGMVIYVREWNGKKKGVGSQWSPWDASVATLPDLTQMESFTYVNEVDVRKVAVGQKVKISLDADPTKKLTGTVAAVANVGEQRPNQDSKVFEVKITIAEADTTLRPGMTTSNAIETATIPGVVSVPLEAVTSDSLTSYVYKVDGRRVVKQQIATGTMNDDEIIVRRGLDAGDRVLLTVPANAAALDLVRLPDDKPKTPGKSTPTATASKH